MRLPVAASTIAALLAFAHVAPAEEPPPRSVTLPEALAYAEAHQPVLAAARARIAAARADADVVRSDWYPRFGATVQLVGATTNNSTTTQLSTSVVDVPRVGGTKSYGTPDFAPYASTFVGIGARQQVFDFGRVSVQAAVYDAIAAAEAQRAELTRLDVVFLVSQAFYGVLAAHAVVTAAEEAFTRAKLHRDFADSAVRSGLRSPIELTRAEADATRFDVARIHARGNLDVAESVLAATMGAPELRIDARDDATAGGLAPLPGDVVDRALHSPAVRIYEQILLAQQARTKAATSVMRPNLFVTVGIDARAGGAPPSSGAGAAYSGWVPEVPNYDVGLVLSWAIWDPAATARANASRVREDGARAELEAARQRAAHAAIDAVERVRIADEALVALDRALDAAKANYAQADARFRAGLGTSTEVADAEQLMVSAEIDRAGGDLQAKLARAALARATAEGR
jgi:outer membrane protein TolC